MLTIQQCCLIRETIFLNLHHYLSIIFDVSEWRYMLGTTTILISRQKTEILFVAGPNKSYHNPKTFDGQDISQLDLVVKFYILSILFTTLVP